MTVRNKVAQRNYRRTYDIVITLEHPKGLCLTWHDLVIFAVSSKQRFSIFSVEGCLCPEIHI